MLLSTLVLVFLCLLTNTEALKCSAGFTYINTTSDQLEVLGTVMECASTNAACLDLAGSNYDDGVPRNKGIHHFYTCSSNASAIRTSYRFGRHCTNQSDYSKSLSYYECHCDWGECNSRTSIANFPPANESDTTIDCYTGARFWVDGFYFAGGVEPCRGVCVAYDPFDRYASFYGCVSVETLDQIGAPSADSTVVWNDANVTFCSTSRCNYASYPLKPISGISCYTGFGTSTKNEFQHRTFHGKVMSCEDGEVCAALSGFTGGAVTPLGDSDYYTCMNVDLCSALIDTSGSTWPPDWWSDGTLQGGSSSCCVGDRCNYNATLMGASSTTALPSSDSPAFATFSGIHPRDQELGGDLRLCTGSAVYLETPEMAIWTCLPSDVCVQFNVTSGNCATNVTVFSKFCCADEPILPDPACPLWGWQRGQTAPDKCYRTMTAYWNADQEHDGAMYQCRTLHINATLPSVGNAFENAEIAEFAPSPGTYLWLGLSPEMNGTWTWDDGTSLGYANWAPNNPSAGDQLVRMFAKSRQWESDPSTRDPFAYVVCQMRRS